MSFRSRDAWSSWEDYGAGKGDRCCVRKPPEGVFQQLRDVPNALCGEHTLTGSFLKGGLQHHYPRPPITHRHLHILAGSDAEFPLTIQSYGTGSEVHLYTLAQGQDVPLLDGYCPHHVGSQLKVPGPVFLQRTCADAQAATMSIVPILVPSRMKRDAIRRDGPFAPFRGSSRRSGWLRRKGYPWHPARAWGSI